MNRNTMFNERTDYLNQIYAGDLVHNNVPINHAEQTKNAGYYLEAQLTALKDGKIYNAVNGTPVRDFKKGDIVGRIYSYVLRNGQIWWHLYDNTFTPHIEGVFNPEIAAKTSRGFMDEQIKAELNKPNAVQKLLQGGSDLLGGTGSLFSSIGKNMGLILTLVVFVVIIFSLSKLQKV